MRFGNQPFLTVITTNSTLISDSLQSQLKYFPDKTLIIGDEAHNLGAPRLEQSLPRRIGLRLALSATPERYFDEQGTQFLFDYFGSVLQPELTLADAIRQGALVHYLYYLRSCTILNKGLPKEQKSERKGVRKVELDGYGNHRQVRPRASL